MTIEKTTSALYDTAAQIMEALLTHSTNPELTHFGQQMFRLYTEHGLPPDIFLERLKGKLGDLPMSEKVYMVSVFQKEMVEHKRKSGITEGRLEKLRRRNREEIKRLIETGELGVY